MATATYNASRRLAPTAAFTLTPALRSRIEGLAAFLVDLLDAADAPRADMEPDTESEAEPDEASRQPATLCPNRALVRTYRPGARQQRAAYRRNGDPLPANLRRLGGLLGGARA